MIREGAGGRVLTPLSLHRFAGKINTSFRQDGSAPRVPGGAAGVVFRPSDGAARLRAARCPERRHEAAGFTGDQCNRVHSGALFRFCVVRCDAKNPQRTDGGNGL